jgi:hypothetical protein
LLGNRLNLFFLRNQYVLSTNEFTVQIRKEIPEILVYCNRMFNNFFKIKRINLEGLKRHFLNKNKNSEILKFSKIRL